MSLVRLFDTFSWMAGKTPCYCINLLRLNYNCRSLPIQVRKLALALYKYKEEDKTGQITVRKRITFALMDLHSKTMTCQP